MWETVQKGHRKTFNKLFNTFHAILALSIRLPSTTARKEHKKHGKIVTFIINESTEKSFTEKVVDIWISNNFIEYYKE